MKGGERKERERKNGEISFLVCNVCSFFILGFRNPKLRDTSLSLSFFLSFFLPFSLFLSPKKKHDKNSKDFAFVCVIAKSLLLREEDL